MKDKDQPIRIGIAGLGFGESVHIPASLSNENIELVGLWHPSKDRLKEACCKHNLSAYENWEDLINDPKIEGLVLALCVTGPLFKEFLLKNLLGFF